MTVAKFTELSGDSAACFQDAMEIGIDRAERTVEKVRGAWVSEGKSTVEQGRVENYRGLNSETVSKNPWAHLRPRFRVTHCRQN